ncbi:diaminopimelate epimerase [Liberiplasma polymorphum]|uniref:diaminopimelate epimerase n=1 Tax=Liberiplasma polymorphum TaxID=3374570 RepID=UPI003776175F
MVFYKYESTGNDFLLTEGPLNNPSHIAKKVCDRHFGIGADGILYTEQSQIADIKMHYYNSDGSIAPMCGNGLRAFVDFVYNHKIVQKKQFNVETLAGILPVNIHEDKTISLKLGKPIFSLNKEDMLEPIEDFGYIKLDISGTPYNVYPLFVGTLHAIVIVDSLKSIDIDTIGRRICTHERFPKHINVNFVEVIDSSHIEVTTYERGAGQTLSCGTGVSASSVVTHLLGRTNADVFVKVPGGNLEVIVSKEVTLKGPTNLIGIIDYRGAL